jgi:hypothetical protein
VVTGVSVSIGFDTYSKFGVHCTVSATAFLFGQERPWRWL